MRVALFSDVHANLPALEAVLCHIDNRLDIDLTYHLGDLVGYAPWPNETVAEIQRAQIQGVSGNYDSTVALGHNHCGCKYEDPHQATLSHQSFEWTCQNTSPQTRNVLLKLPFRIDLRPFGGHVSGPNLILIHGAANMNTLYWTQQRGDDFCRKMAKSLGAKPGDVIAFGHTHIPWTKKIDEISFVNTGSVGRPKDGDWRTGYVVVDFQEEPSVTFERLDYDLARATAGIRKSDLPEAFAKNLETGATG